MIEAIVSQVLASLIVGVFGQLSSPEHAALNQAIRRLALASRRDTGQEANEIVRAALPSSLWTSENVATVTAFLDGPVFRGFVVNALAMKIASDSPDYSSEALHQIDVNLRMLGADASISHGLAREILDRLYAQSAEVLDTLVEQHPTAEVLIRDRALQERSVQALEKLATASRVLVSDESFDRLCRLNQAYIRQIIQQTKDVLLPHPYMKRRISLDDIFIAPSLDMGIDPSTGMQKLIDWAFEEQLVILGDPGAGKSTLGQKICLDLARSASHGSDKILVTPLPIRLRDYGAASESGPLSFVQLLCNTARTEYQMPDSNEDLESFFEFLLLNGRALVVFDGLDEFLDPTLRRQVADRVEHFAVAYPAASILVTSRRVGYDWAPLDYENFSTVEILPFSTPQVEAYASKWFAAADELGEEDADTLTSRFLVESAHADELRSTPLLLSLLCSVYIGRGYIPRNRPEVYEACTTLLFNTWDRDRGLRPELEIEHHIVPLLSYIAWWMYIDANLEHGVPENQIIDKATEYLKTFRFEDYHQARAAAKNFLRYCRDRLWVFTEVGSESDVPLYAFTHHTFLEYLASEHLVYTKDDLSDFCDAVARLAMHSSGSIVPDLATQIFNKRTYRGDAVLMTALDYVEWAPRHSSVPVSLPTASGMATVSSQRSAIEDRAIMPNDSSEGPSRSSARSLLAFVVRCLEFIVPRPSVARSAVELSVLGARRDGNVGQEQRTAAISGRLSLIGRRYGRAVDTSLEPGAMSESGRIACEFLSAAGENWEMLGRGLTDSIMVVLSDDNRAEMDLLVALDLATSLVSCAVLAKFDDPSVSLAAVDYSTRVRQSARWPSEVLDDFNFWFEWQINTTELVAEAWRNVAETSVSHHARGVTLGVCLPNKLIDLHGACASLVGYWSYTFHCWIAPPLIEGLLWIALGPVSSGGAITEMFHALGVEARQDDFLERIQEQNAALAAPRNFPLVDLVSEVFLSYLLRFTNDADEFDNDRVVELSYTDSDNAEGYSARLRGSGAPNVVGGRVSVERDDDVAVGIVIGILMVHEVLELKGEGGLLREYVERLFPSKISSVACKILRARASTRFPDEAVLDTDGDDLWAAGVSDLATEWASGRDILRRSGLI